MTNGSDEDRFLTGGAFDALSDFAHPGADAFIGRELGDYRVTGLIAEGGMGRVYRAERIDGSFERDVAVKVSPIGGLDERMRSRFAAEQAILATLNHPNICQLYDARVTEEGWPCIVMELVDGSAIDKHASNRGLTLRQRLDLLIDVVDAISYAHARLVVHRDIKPSNIMISADGRPKLLDFGIAQLLESNATILTQVGAMTPRYASPEQLLGQRITIASDIYQLGLLIFEGLTGEPVSDDESLTEAIQRAASGRSVALPAAGRAKLDRELLLIIEQCLRVAPDERYRDASRLRDDLVAFRDGFPVAAAGQGAIYRFRKLVSRNIPATIISVIASVAIISGTIFYTYQVDAARDEAERQAAAAALEAEKATQVSDFFVNLFQKSAPESAKGEDVLVRDLLDLGVEEARTELDGQDELRANLLTTIGAVKSEMGYREEAAILIDEAIAQYRELNLDDPMPLSRALYQRGVVDWYTSDLVRAQGWLEEAQQLAESVDTEQSLLHQTFVLNTLGMVASQLNDFDTAIAWHERSLAARREYYGESHWEVAASLMNFAIVYTKLGRYEDALPLFEQGYETSLEALDPFDPRLARVGLWLGRAYVREGQLAKADPILVRSMETERKVWGDDHPNYSNALLNLAILRIAQERLEDAVALLEEGVAIEREALGEEHPMLANSMFKLGEVYMSLGRLDDAEPYLREAEEILRSAYSGAHRDTAGAIALVAQYEELTGNADEAIRRYEEATAMMAETVGDDHPHTIRPRLATGRLLLQQGDLAAAEQRYQQALVALEANQREVPEWGEYTEPYLAALVNAGRDADAKAFRARLEKVRSQVIWPQPD